MKYTNNLIAIHLFWLYDLFLLTLIYMIHSPFPTRVASPAQPQCQGREVILKILGKIDHYFTTEKTTTRELWEMHIATYYIQIGYWLNIMLRGTRYVKDLLDRDTCLWPQSPHVVKSNKVKKVVVRVGPLKLIPKWQRHDMNGTSSRNCETKWNIVDSSSVKWEALYKWYWGKYVYE